MTRWFQRNRLMLLACCCLATGLGRPAVSWCDEAGQIPAVLPELRVRTVTSESGRFQVRGDDISVSQDLLRWVEHVTGRLEDLLQARIVGPDGSFMISHSIQTNVTAGRVGSDITFQNGHRSYRLSMLNSQLVRPEDSERQLVHLLVDCWVECLPEREPAVEQLPDGSVSNRVPEWLSEGLRQNLTTTRKARNSEWVLDAWESGSVPSLSMFLAQASAAKNALSDPILFQAQGGVVVGWLVSLPDSATRFAKMRARLSAGLPLDHWWLATSVWGLKDKRTFDDAWDRWILKQKHIIYEPGLPTRRAIAQFRAELAVAAGKGGIPPGAEVAARTGFAGLLEFRKAEWLPAYVRHKTAALRVLATGRGREMMKVADLYCRFLEGLDGWSGDGRLEKMLQEAEGKLSGLEQALEADSLRVLTAAPGIPSNVFE